MVRPNWNEVIARLDQYPPGTHRLLPPCPPTRLRDVERALGPMPFVLRDMLTHLNGGRLFIRYTPLVALFGISTSPSPSPLEWASDWYIDKLTPEWRARSDSRERDWAIGMMSYGGLIIFQGNEMVREWDTARKIWDPESLQFGDWIKKVFGEGDTLLKET